MRHRPLAGDACCALWLAFSPWLYSGSLWLWRITNALRVSTAAMEYAGGSKDPAVVVDYLDMSDRLKTWHQQWNPLRTATFKLPHRLNDVPIQLLQASVRLTASSTTRTPLASAPVVPRPYRNMRHIIL
jgi:hypothetical protein